MEMLVTHRCTGTGASCAICLADHVEGETLATLACSHTFHRACVVRWLSANPTCPLCKSHALCGPEPTDRPAPSRSIDCQQPPGGGSTPAAAALAHTRRVGSPERPPAPEQGPAAARREVRAVSEVVRAAQAEMRCQPSPPAVATPAVAPPIRHGRRPRDEAGRILAAAAREARRDACGARGAQAAAAPLRCVRQTTYDFVRAPIRWDARRADGGSIPDSEARGVSRGRARLRGEVPQPRTLTLPPSLPQQPQPRAHRNVLRVGPSTAPQWVRTVHHGARRSVTVQS